MPCACDNARRPVTLFIALLLSSILGYVSWQRLGSYGRFGLVRQSTPPVTLFATRSSSTPTSTSLQATRPRTPAVPTTLAPTHPPATLLDADDCDWKETVGKAELYVDPALVRRVVHRNWQLFFRSVAAGATRPVAETFELVSVLGGRFRFMLSEHGPNYLEWRTEVWTNDSSASIFSGLAVPFLGGPPDCDLELSGPVAFYRHLSPQNFQYGHLLLDLLPLLHFLATEERESTLVLQRDPEGIIASFMQWYDGDLARRLVFTNETEVVCTQGRLSLLKAKTGIARPDNMRLLSLWRPLRSHIRRLKTSQAMVRAIAYQRERDFVKHGRIIGQFRNQQLLFLVKEAMKAHGRRGDVEVFDGKVGGQPMTFEQQYRLFNGAFLAFGPQGTGLANILWMQNADCHRRPAVIEFICSADTMRSAGCWNWQNSQKMLSIKSTWAISGGAFWARYFHVWLLRAALPRQVWIDEKGFNRSLYEALRPFRL